MGYHNEVGMYITGPLDELKLLLTQHKLEWGTVTGALAADFVLDETPPRVCFYISGMKWNDQFTEVRALKDLWDKAMGNIKLSGRFCRIGEDTNDTEEEGFGEEDLYDTLTVERVMKVSF